MLVYSYTYLSEVSVVDVTGGKNTFNVGVDVVVHFDVTLFVQFNAAALQMLRQGFVTNGHK